MSIEIRITDAANESPEAIRKVVAALLVLSGDVPVQQDLFKATDAPLPSTDVRIEVSQDPNVGVVFTAAEIAEAEHLGNAPAPVAAPTPSPQEAFAQSTAAAAPSPIAPAAPPAPLPTPTPPAPTPPAAPVASTIAAPAAPSTASPAADVELDTEGLPWDARIHSSSKEKIKDGTWRLKRGVDKALVDDIKSQYRGATTTQPINAAPVPPAVGAPVAASSDSAVSTSTAPRTWLDTITRVTKGAAAGAWQQAAVDQFITESLGAASIAQINNNQPALDALNAYLDTLGAGQA